MIPNLITIQGSPYKLLPPGIYLTDLTEVFVHYASNAKRLILFNGMKKGIENLFTSGCPQIFLDGSYITSKPLPNDYEIVWDTNYVNPNLLDPIFFDLRNKRENQKLKYGGEYFPSSIVEGGSEKPFLEFFQTDRDSGSQKGILKILNH